MSSDREQEQANAFIDLLIAALMDAAGARKMTQLKTTCQPPGHTRPQMVRIIIVPETMDIEWKEPLRKT